jgi:hypothetical protein
MTRTDPAPPRRRPWSVVLLVSGSLLLAACSPTETLLGVRSNTSVISAEPVLTTAQAAEIAVRALGQAQRADARRTEDSAAAAYTGLALRVAVPSYVVQKVIDRDGNPSGQALGRVPTPTRIIVTAGRGFPRSLVAVWTPVGGVTPQLAVLTSDRVSAPYRVSARTTLVPGATLPATPSNARGASVLSPTVPGLVATPKNAVKDLAALMQTGRSGKTRFARSQVVSDVRTNAAGQAKDVAKVATFRQRHVVDPEAPRTIRTADGGALVVAAIVRTDTFSVRDGAGSITPPPAYRALAKGVKKITESATVTTVQVVAVVLPVAGQGKARLVGFTETPVAVKAS